MSKPSPRPGDVSTIKIALIPPAQLENFALETNFHLALAIPELMRRINYVSTYARAGQVGDYIIMDNGAAEDATVTPQELLQAAWRCKASEVVAPDKLRDGALTVSRTKSFLYNYDLQGLKAMAVAQGIHVREFRACVRAFADIPEVTTVGIPRLMVDLVQKSARIDLANWIQEKFPDRFEIHLLGASPSWAQEVKYAAKYAPHIRSMDTSLPFNYAYAGVDLSTTREVVPRPPDYFATNKFLKVNTKLVRRNVETFLKWADAPALVRPVANLFSTGSENA